MGHPDKSNEVMRRFHPAVQRWFRANFESATDCQIRAWPAICEGSDTLVAAPTGSGKTLAAFLAVIDELVREGVSSGGLPAQTHVLYVSPLKALSYDIERNLEGPLSAICAELAEMGYPDVEITTGVRTGDTPQSQRRAMIRRSPHILVTTPESLYLLLTSASGRQILRTVRKLIVDEIHSIIESKRGAHFALSGARLEHVAENKFAKIGLSATQRPVDTVASFLTGSDPHGCVIADSGHVRSWDLAIEVPCSSLDAVMSSDSWNDLYGRIAHLVGSHATTLIFVNTRRHAERATRHLAELLGEEHVAAHHGSLSKQHRHNAEQRLKAGQLRALVATASLELGIDIGDIDLVCQIGSPRSISVFIQRVGRSGHSIGKIPKGRIFPTTRDELCESAALIKATCEGDMEQLAVCGAAADVLAQHIVAEAGIEDRNIDDLYRSMKRAWPYRSLELAQFEYIVLMLSEGFTLRRGRRAAYIHVDAVNRMVRGRKGARLVALTNGGAIPDQFDYDVILQPEEIRIGSVNEDFAFESLRGDIFQLGNASYRVLQVKQGRVLVEDAKGLPPNVPFWLGESRGRSDALSEAVSNLRSRVCGLLDGGDAQAAVAAMAREYSLDLSVAQQLVDYLGMAKSALGALPTRDRIVYERFFDEAGDMHLVVHSIYGSRVNKAWGLALRKRFCVRFDFELQAAALEDSLVLSLGPTHSFELSDVGSYLKSRTVRQTLTQAIFTAPMFETRWRWVANTALAVPRNRNGKKVAPQLQRTDSEDLLALLFPDQVACQENRQGPVRVPEHPLVTQTIEDCLHEVMDADGLDSVLGSIEGGTIKVEFRDLPEPSVLAQEILTAKPYAFLDDAPAEERRTLAVQTRRMTASDGVRNIGRLDPDAIASLCDLAWPQPGNADELHDALLILGCIDQVEACSDRNSKAQRRNAAWDVFFNELVGERRATRICIDGSRIFWVAAERLNEFMLLHPSAEMDPAIEPAGLSACSVESADAALDSMLRGRLEIAGPCSVAELAQSVGVHPDAACQSLLRLETEGTVMRGSFTASGRQDEWCDRRFLSRIHKRTLQRLRSEIEPVSPDAYVRYLTRWMRIGPDDVGEGVNALDSVFDLLEGFEAPVAAWEAEILPARVYGYTPELLNHLSASGTIVWSRLSKYEIKGQNRTKRNSARRFGTSLRNAPLTFLRRQNLTLWRTLMRQRNGDSNPVSALGSAISELLQAHGALFVDEILDGVHLLPSHVEEGLVELFTAGMATCDHFGGVRSLLTPESARYRRNAKRYSVSRGVRESGRWSLVERMPLNAKADSISEHEIDAFIANVLLRRYGIVFRSAAMREQRTLVPWNRLLQVYRRMEDRGEIRGGRFVSGVAGEQFALPGAIELLRQARRAPASVGRITVSAADPLNFTGILDGEVRVAPNARTRVEITDGVCSAVIKGGRRIAWHEFAAGVERSD